MYKQFFEYNEPGVSKAEIDELATFLGKPLPEDFVALYSEIGGVRVISQYSSVVHNNEGLTRINDLFVLFEIRAIIEMYRQEEQDYGFLNYRTDCLLPIFGASENYICVGYSGRYADKIYYINVTSGMFEATDIPIIHVADNLLDFFLSLKS